MRHPCRLSAMEMELSSAAWVHIARMQLMQLATSNRSSELANAQVQRYYRSELYSFNWKQDESWKV